MRRPVYFHCVDSPAAVEKRGGEGGGEEKGGEGGLLRRAVVAWVIRSDGRVTVHRLPRVTEDGRALDDLVHDLHVKMALNSAAHAPSRGQPRSEDAVEHWTRHLASSGASPPAACNRRPPQM